MADRQSVDPKEVAKFAALAAQWWDPKGEFAPLHRMNPVRLAFLRERILAHFGRADSGRRPLAGLRLLDVGCGGGLISEPMARLGADVCGLDGAEDGVRAAAAHAGAAGLAIDYRVGAVEDLVGVEMFDVVLALEIIEHVADVNAFGAALMRLVKPGGLLLISTINRTLAARALALFAAERILHWAPEGTHDYEKLVTPQEIVTALPGLQIEGPFGLSFDPLHGWRRSNDSSVNYFMSAAKPLSSA